MVNPSQEAQNRLRCDVTALRLRLVHSLGHHYDLSIHCLGYPVGFGPLVLEVRVLLTHHDEGGCGDLTEQGCDRSVVRAGCQGERLSVSAAADARHDQRSVLIEVSRTPAGVELGEICLPGEGYPGPGDRHAQADALECATCGA